MRNRIHVYESVARVVPVGGGDDDDDDDSYCGVRIEATCKNQWLELCETMMEMLAMMIMIVIAECGFRSLV